MKQTPTLEDILSSHVVYRRHTNKWNELYCEVCGDGSRTKGPRGGWRFEGVMAFYNCFNCGVKASFDPDRDIPFSKDMRNVLEKFGVPAKEYTQAVPLKRTTGTTKPVATKCKIKAMDFPDYFMPLSEVEIDNDIFIKAKEFLKLKYDLTTKSYDFHISTGNTNGGIEEQIMAKSLMNRIIIPYIKNDTLVYWQARALNADAKKPYINAETSRSNIIFGFDKLYTNTANPLYVVESAFDALNLDGVGVLENNLTAQQIDILNKSPRTKVVVPDMKGDSYKLAEQAIELGWSVSLPNMGGCKDVSETITKYGRMYLFSQIANNISSGKAAKIKLSLKK